jgi:hypothetical protein
MIVNSPNRNFETEVNTEFRQRSTCGSTLKVIRVKELTNMTSKGVRDGMRLTGPINEHEHS